MTGNLLLGFPPLSDVRERMLLSGVIDLAEPWLGFPLGSDEGFCAGVKTPVGSGPVGSCISDSQTAVNPLKLEDGQ